MRYNVSSSSDRYRYRPPAPRQQQIAVVGALGTQQVMGWHAAHLLAAALAARPLALGADGPAAVWLSGLPPLDPANRNLQWCEHYRDTVPPIWDTGKAQPIRSAVSFCLTPLPVLVVCLDRSGAVCPGTGAVNLERHLSCSPMARPGRARAAAAGRERELWWRAGGGAVVRGRVGRGFPPRQVQVCLQADRAGT